MLLLLSSRENLILRCLSQLGEYPFRSPHGKDLLLSLPGLFAGGVDTAHLHVGVAPNKSTRFVRRRLCSASWWVYDYDKDPHPETFYFRLLHPHVLVAAETSLFKSSPDGCKLQRQKISSEVSCMQCGCYNNDSMHCWLGSITQVKVCLKCSVLLAKSFGNKTLSLS